VFYSGLGKEQEMKSADNINRWIKAVIAKGPNSQFFYNYLVHLFKVVLRDKVHSISCENDDQLYRTQGVILIGLNQTDEFGETKLKPAQRNSSPPIRSTI
jgi:hypothetical protein